MPIQPTVTEQDLRYLIPPSQAGNFTPIDLSNVTPPDIVEQLDYEAVRLAMINDFKNRWPDYDALVESDPVIKLIEVAAYRETVLRARVNHAVRSVLVAYAQRHDLDQLAALVNVERRIIGRDQNGNDLYESDAMMRLRILLAWEGLAATGTVGAYLKHVYEYSPAIAHASVYSPRPGYVRIVPLLNIGDGQPPRVFLRGLRRYITNPYIKNLTDFIQVRPPRFVDFDIRAQLIVYPGTGSDVVLANARKAINTYLAANYRIGRDINRSSIMAALHQSGVSNVRLADPNANIVIRSNQIARCKTVNIEVSLYEDQ
jgi:phage-related baseplate assembly protein